MKHIYKFIFIFILFILPTISLADGFYFNSQGGTFYTKEDFSIQVYLDTGVNKVNAIDGAILFDSEHLDVKNILDGNSAVDFWLDRPQKTEPDKIVFSGITAGGFSGSKVFLFTIIFHPKKTGQGQVSFGEMHALENDGSGTPISLNQKSFEFLIKNGLDYINSNDSVSNDKNKPEIFYPHIARDPLIFENKYFMVFSTVDKDSGIDHFEIKETYTGIDGSFTIANSPYLLKDQGLYKNIYIRAFDKNGNIRLVKMGAENHLILFVIYLFVGIIILICFILIRKKYLKL